MRKSHCLLSALALLGSSVTLLPPARTAPPPGPGTVIEAVRDWLAAIDRGDAEALAARLAPAPGDAFTLDDDGALASIEDPQPALFDDAIAAMATAGDGRAREPLRTEVRSIRAACPSGDLSFAVVELERHYGRGADAKRVALRATALLRWTDGGDAEPGMRVFHWHAAPLGDASKAR